MQANCYRNPTRGMAQLVLDSILNSDRLRRMVTSVPMVKLASDVRDVVYLNWLIPQERVAPWECERIRLKRLGGFVPFTVLTYKHQRFGPSMLGPLRPLCLSQSNWRFYVESIDGELPELPTVLFVKNIMDSGLYTVGSRLGSNILQTHRPLTFTHQCDATGTSTQIEPGEGSSPDLSADLEAVDDKTLPDSIQEAYQTWEEAARWLSLQDAAVARIRGTSHLAHSTISLPIVPNQIRPLQLTKLSSDWLAPVTSGCDPFCFLVPSVEFFVLSETRI